MALTPEQIDDFVTLTQPLFKRRRWTDISLEYQEYVSAQLIDEKKVVEQGGPEINFKIQTKNTGNARNTGLYATDVTRVEDVMTSAKVYWSYQTTNYSYDVNEDLFQSDRETIIKELTVRDHDAMNSMAELNELNLWSAPSGTSDTRPTGVPFWLQTSATEGFNGGNPSTHSSGCAGVSSTTYPRWRNYTFTYTQYTLDSLVKAVKKAAWNTNFRAPVPHPELGYGKSDYNIYTTYRVVEPLERLAETRNDNLGSDLAKYLGQVTIGGVPVKAVPYLEANDTADPIYGINWKVFRPYVKRGVNMRRNPPKQSARQHNVREVHIDNAMNFVCTNRRLCYRGYKV